MEMLAPITWPSSSSSEEEDEMDQGASPRPRGGGGGRRLSIVISFGGHSELIPLLRAPPAIHDTHTKLVQRAVLSDVAGAYFFSEFVFCEFVFSGTFFGGKFVGGFFFGR